MSLVVESVSHRNWEPWVFTADELDDLEAFFRVYGFGVLRGLWTEEQMAELGDPVGLAVTAARLLRP